MLFTVDLAYELGAVIGALSKHYLGHLVLFIFLLILACGPAIEPSSASSKTHDCSQMIVSSSESPIASTEDYQRHQSRYECIIS